MSQHDDDYQEAEPAPPSQWLVARHEALREEGRRESHAELSRLRAEVETLGNVITGLEQTICHMEQRIDQCDYCSGDRYLSGGTETFTKERLSCETCRAAQHFTGMTDPPTPMVYCTRFTQKHILPFGCTDYMSR